MSDTPTTCDGHAPEPLPDRRSALFWLAGFLGVLATLALSVPLVGYLLGALIRPRKDVWIDLGSVGEFPAGETRLKTFENPVRQPWDGVTANSAIYVRNLGKSAEGKDRFLVLSVNCTHLGCPVSWFPQSGLFLCPCHGGVYYEDGAHASGPPPRGLYHFNWKVAEGKLLVFGGHLPTLQDTMRDEKQA